MFRRNLIVLVGAALAAGLAACYSPTTSAGALRYPITSTAGAPAVGEPSPAPDAPPAPASTNDPLYRLDMP